MGRDGGGSQPANNATSLYPSPVIFRQHISRDQMQIELLSSSTCTDEEDESDGSGVSAVSGVSVDGCSGDDGVMAMVVALVCNKLA